MVDMPPDDMPKVMRIYLELSQYPILASRIRNLMRQELFRRHVISPDAFDNEVRARAIESQHREGLVDPMEEEPTNVWTQRLEAVSEQLTDFYFAYNLPHDLFQDIVRDVLSQRMPDTEVLLSFNPEVAPWQVLFERGIAYESAPPETRKAVEHHLREIRVVLLKTMISDDLSFVRVARKYFTVADLKNIYSRRIGRGKIGGKAAGMLLAYRILQGAAHKQGLDVDNVFSIPESWYIGSDVFYDFQANNSLFAFMNQKYKTIDQIIEDHDTVYDAYMQCALPAYVEEQLYKLLGDLSGTPLIVRSSSLLEDSVGTSFAGKYDSFFLPNQGTPDENYEAFTKAVIKIYASVVRPEALIYREQMGLIDYDERMAILIQTVTGEQSGRYFFPHIAGVGFGHNPYSWTTRIDPGEGLLRMVAGLGTRAVDRVGGDYPRMVALSHPTMRPEVTAGSMRRYSQHEIDVLDLEQNEIVTLPVKEVITPDHPAYGTLMSLEQDGSVLPMHRRPLQLDPEQAILTFDRLLEPKSMSTGRFNDENFATSMRHALRTLGEEYGIPVEIEFAGTILDSYPTPVFRLTLLQCRPLSRRVSGMSVSIPDDIPEEDILFTAHKQIPQGAVEGIQYIVFVRPDIYASLDDPNMRIEVGRVVGRVNQLLEDKPYMLIGPGRWGSTNMYLGVKVSYADIYNTKVLVEVAFEGSGVAPELSLGTHFFQDLVEANIYALALYPDYEHSKFNVDWITSAPNILPELLPGDSDYAPCIHVVDVSNTSDGRSLSVLMDSQREYAVAFLQKPESHTSNPRLIRDMDL